MTRFLVIFLLIFTVGCVENKKTPTKKEQLRQYLEQKTPSNSKCPDGKCPTVSQQNGPNRLPINVSKCIRYKNYVIRAEGSCVHASLATLFMYLGEDKWANYWTNKYGGGETPTGLVVKLNKEGLTHETTTKGELALVERNLDKGLPMIVTFKRNHMCLLIGMDKTYISYGDVVVKHPAPNAYIIDPNFPQKVEIVSRDYFLKDWRSNGGWATVLIP